MFCYVDVSFSLLQIVFSASISFLHIAIALLPPPSAAADLLSPPLAPSASVFFFCHFASCHFPLLPIEAYIHMPFVCLSHIWRHFLHTFFALPRRARVYAAARCLCLPREIFLLSYILIHISYVTFILHSVSFSLIYIFSHAMLFSLLFYSFSFFIQAASGARRASFARGRHAFRENAAALFIFLIDISR